MESKEYKFSPFFEMIDTIIQKPRWFGIQKVQDIYFFISGYKSCIMGRKIIDPDYERFKKMFGEDGSALIIAIKDKDLYSKEKFLLWKNLGDSILQIDGVISVISEAKLFNLVNDTANSQFMIKPIFSDVSFKEKSIEQIKSEIRRNPIYNGIMYNDSANVSLMMVTLDENFLIDKLFDLFPCI